MFIGYPNLNRAATVWSAMTLLALVAVPAGAEVLPAYDLPGYPSAVNMPDWQTGVGLDQIPQIQMDNYAAMRTDMVVEEMRQSEFDYESGSVFYDKSETAPTPGEICRYMPSGTPGCPEDQ